jgi:hypothetical protein
MDKEQEERLEALVHELDEVIFKYQEEFAPHNIAGVLLSRVTLLMTMDPETGKSLMKYCWEKLDEIQQANPGDMF